MSILQPRAFDMDRIWPGRTGSVAQSLSWSGTGLVAQLVFKTSLERRRQDTLQHAKARFSRDFTGDQVGLEHAGTPWNRLGWWTGDGHGLRVAAVGHANTLGASRKIRKRGATGLPAGTGSSPMSRDVAEPVRRRDLSDDVADTRRRSASFDGRCYLCGQPINGGIFCHAHSWAARGRWQ